MAKLTKKEREAYLASIQESLSDDSGASLSSIQTILEKQSESLHNIETYSKQIRLVDAASALEEKKILDDEDIMVKEIKNLSKHMEDFYYLMIDVKDIIKKGNDKKPELDEKSIDKLGDTISNSINNTIITGLSKENVNDLTEHGKGIKTYKSIGDRVSGVVEGIKSIPGKLAPSRILNTLGVVDPNSGGIISNALNKINDRKDFIKQQRMLGVEDSDEKLKEKFNERYKISKQIKKNEEKIGEFKNMGLSEEQIRRTEAGKSLYSKQEELASKLPELDEVARLKVSPESLKEQEQNQAESEKENSESLEQEKEQTSILKQLLEFFTKRKQPEETESPKAEKDDSSFGISDAISGAKSFGKTAGNIAKTVGNVGKSVLSTGARMMAPLASAAAVPLAVGVAGAAAAGYAANKFSDSFGEGGFDVIHALHKQGIIDYNFGDSEILDWKAVEQLDNDTLEKMIKSDEFSEDDTKKLQAIIDGNNMKLKPAIEQKTDQLYKEKMKEQPEELQKDVGTQIQVRDESKIEAELALKEQGIDKPYTTMVNGKGEIVSPDKYPVSGSDYILKPQPEDANAVYNKSTENVGMKEQSSVGISAPIVSAPTVNNSSKTVNQQTVKLPVRNQESSSSRYISSRFAVQ